MGDKLLSTRRSSAARLRMKFRSLPRSTINLIKRAVALLVTLIIIKFFFWNSSKSSILDRSHSSLLSRRSSSSASSDAWPFPLARTRLYRNKIPITQVLNHAPGFTVFKDLYYQNGRWVVFTDSPYEIPDPEHIAFNGKVPEAIELAEVRAKPIMCDMHEYIFRDRRAIFPEAALQRFDPANVQVTPGFSFIFNDDNFINHYYHLIGEMFLGAWRVWDNLFTKNDLGLPLPDPDRFIFMRLDDRMYDHEDVTTWKGGWRDRQGLNVWYTNKLFPNTPIETAEDWEERTASDKVFRFETVVLADRFAGHKGPTAAFKPWGDAFRMDVHQNWLKPLRERLLDGYKGPIPVGTTPSGAPNTKLPVITYITRQQTTRRLTNESHAELMLELNEIKREGLAEVNVEIFEERSVQDQIAIMGRTSILISVHGNGLTNSLWMNPGPHSGVFEFQPDTCRFNDFGPLAEANGIPHWIVNNDAMCAPGECGARGCAAPGVEDPNSDKIVIDSRFISKQVRSILKTGKPDHVPLPSYVLYDP